MQPLRFLRLPDVMEITGLTKPHIYRLMSEGKFPRPYKLSVRAVGWKLSEIEAWLNSRQQLVA